MEMITKFGHLQKSNSDGYTFKLSDETIDRHGEKMLISGIDIEKFKSNPVAFFNHQSYELPIGKWDNIRKQGNELLADLIFSEEIEESKKLKQYVSEGFLSAVSVGFIPLETAKEKFENKSITVYTKSELLEVSLVTIPANPNALQMKAGAVLNNKNKADLKKALELIQSVLDSSMTEEKPQTEEKELISKLELLNIIKEASNAK